MNAADIEIGKTYKYSGGHKRHQNMICLGVDGGNVWMKSTGIRRMGGYTTAHSSNLTPIPTAEETVTKLFVDVATAIVTPGKGKGVQALVDVMNDFIAAKEAGDIIWTGHVK